MKKFQLREGSFLKNVIILMFGSGVSQLIPFLISPVLSRLFDSSDFGIFTIFTTLTAFLAVVATLRYELAIMLPAKKSDAFHLLILSMGLSIVISIIIFIISLIFSEEIAQKLSLPQLKNWLPYLGLSVLLLGIIQSMSFWFNRNKNYKTLSSNMIGQSTTTATVSTANGFAGLHQGGLIIGSMSGQLISTILYFRKIVKTDGRRFKNISIKRVKNVAEEYSDYPKFSFPHRLIDMISVTGIPIILTLIFTEAIVGWYGFMLRILKAPLAILASSLGQVFYQQFSEKVAMKYSVKELFLKTIRNIALITLPFFLFILIWGPDIFAWVFSEKWRQAGIYAQYLSPWLFFSTITSPVSQIPLTLGKVKMNMIAGIANNLTIILIFIIASRFYQNPEMVFFFVGIIMPLFFMALLGWYFKLIVNYESERLK